MSDSTPPSDDGKKAAAGGDGTPPRVVTGPTAGDTAANPIVLTSPEREAINRTAVRARSRPPGAPLSTAAPPVAGAGPAVASAAGNFLTLFNEGGYFMGRVTTGFASRLEAGTALNDPDLISDLTFNSFVRDEVLKVRSNDAYEAPPSSLAEDIPGRIFPNLEEVGRGTAYCMLREYATKFYLTRVPWDGRLVMGDLLVYVFVMLNYLRDGLKLRANWRMGDLINQDVDFPKTYSNIVEGLGPLFSAVMVGGPSRANKCDTDFHHWNMGKRNPDFLFLVLPIFRMVKAFFPGKAAHWSTAFDRTGNSVIKAQSEKIAKNGVYSNNFLHQVYDPDRTEDTNSKLLSGMLFEFAIILAYVNPSFCADSLILRKVLAKGRTVEQHYNLLDEEIDTYRDPGLVVSYQSADGIFTYEARVLQQPGPVRRRW
jgi:hypothetical protein